MTATRCDLKIGFACNNRCLFCAQGEKRRSTGLVPAAQLVEHMRRAFEPGRGLVLTGGEPTIRKDLVELVKVARGCGYSPIQIQTNGRMLAYSDLVKRLIDAGVTEFSPALHGPTAAIHDALTRSEGSFDQTVAGIANAVESGAIVVTNSVVVRQNLPHLTATVDILADLGVYKAQFALVHPVGTAMERFDQVVPRISLAAAAMRMAVERGRERGLKMVVEAVPLCLMRGFEDAVVEPAIPETTVVDADGEAFAFSNWRRENGKSNGPPCERCDRRAECEGPWREYPARYGWSEYVPYTTVREPSTLGGASA